MMWFLILTHLDHHINAVWLTKKLRVHIDNEHCFIELINGITIIIF